MSGLNRWSFSNFFKYQDGGCLNKYHKVINDIQERIDAFNKISNRNVQTEWYQLNSYIIQKDQELKECYKNRHVNVKLTDVEEIKNFRKKCTRNRTCYNQPPQVKKPTITNPSVQGTCKESKRCKNEKPARVDVKSKLVSGAANPHSSEIKNPQEQSQNKADAQKSRQENIASQSQSSIMPLDVSVITNEKTSKEIVNHHSTTSGVEETQVQQLKASVASGVSELHSPPSDPSKQCISGETSNLTCTSTEKILDTKDIQTNQHNVNPLDTNDPGSQESLSEIVAEGTGGDKGITTGRSHNLSLTESSPDSLQRADEPSLTASTDEERPRAVSSDTENTRSEEVSSASLASALSSDSGTNGITDVDISTNYIAYKGESNSVNFSHDHPLDSEGSCIGSTCNKAQNSEITSDNNNDILGKLSHVFDIIQQNKENMIKASIPMGIILLLTLLLKYTPLWRILTKKKRKEPVDMNEELHSVLKEASIMDEERSIPFSYSAFEYSTFV